MAGQNWQIDPTTRDYVIDRGSAIPTDRIFEKAYFVLTNPATKWPYGLVGQGSFLWKFENVKRTSLIEQQFSAITEEAVRDQLVKTGQAISVLTTNIETSRTGTSNNIAIVPVTPPLPLASFVPV